MNFRKPQLILVLGVVLLVMSPILVYFLRHTDFNTTGQIGDTIGGITSPISALIGSILVFYALRAQIEANDIIQRQFQEQKKEESLLKTQQFFLDQFKIIREDVVGFTFIDSRNTEKNEIKRMVSTKDDSVYFEIKGAEAFEKTMRSFLRTSNTALILSSPKFKEFYSILSAINHLTDQVQASELNKEEKENILTLIEYTLQSKISIAFQIHDKVIAGNPSLKGFVPDILISTYDEILSKLLKGRSIFT